MSHTESQTKKGRFARWDNVSQNFTLQYPSIEPTHVLLIDDVITTGATLEALVRVIQENKPELRVSIVSLAITK
jgi:predicted amidophosphoribosyltransferase